MKHTKQFRNNAVVSFQAEEKHGPIGTHLVRITMDVANTRENLKAMNRPQQLTKTENLTLAILTRITTTTWGLILLRSLTLIRHGLLSHPTLIRDTSTRNDLSPNLSYVALTTRVRIRKAASHRPSARSTYVHKLHLEDTIALATYRKQTRMNLLELRALK